jgi:hypothetical protein
MHSRRLRRKEAERSAKTMKHKGPLIALMVVNVLLFTAGLLSYIWTAKNNKIINSIAEEFVYEEENGKVELSVATDKTVTMRFNKNSVKIYDAYQAQSREESLCITLFVRKYADEKGYSVERSNTDLYGEYCLHNLLYDANFKRERTADADLEYKADRRWYVNAVGSFIGWIGGI